jgi:type IV pilus assembly protein PilA
MRKQKGFSLIELLIVVAIILIIAAIAIPSLLRARISANNSAAASSIRTINTAEVSYITNYAAAGYSNSLSNLGPGAAPGVDCTKASLVVPTSACLIDGILGCGNAGPCNKSGYSYFLMGTGGDTSGAPVTPNPDYMVSAAPINFGLSGSTNLCSIPDAVVRSQNPPVPGASPPATPVATVGACAVAPWLPLQ